MTEESTLQYIKVLGTQQGIADEVLEDHALNVMSLGISFFWNAHPWPFKMKTATLDTSGSGPFSLPGDFSALVTATERTSITGLSMRFIDKVDFEMKYPNLDSYAASTPQVGCVYFDAGEPKIKFYPRPSVDVMYLDYLWVANPQITDVPDNYSPGLMACFEQFLYKPGPMRIEAWKMANAELDRLLVVNQPVQAWPDHMLDDTETRIVKVIPWVSS